MPEVTIILAETWDDPRIAHVQEDCMLPIAQGVYFHHRLQSVIMIRIALPPAVANSLPW
jgi:hypothetical protein